MAEILAAVGVVTVLIVLLLFAVIAERVTRSIAVIRHVRERYREPAAELQQQLDRMRERHHDDAAPNG
jgi:hypothetical protein